MSKPYLRIISDVHGMYKEYVGLAREAEFSLQLGDLGFDYTNLDKHLRYGQDYAIAGNHDNYDKCSDQYFKKQSFFLGDYGMKYVGKISFFFVRGAWSIDQKQRVSGIDWFPEEQLSYEKLDKAIQQYKANKPDIVITHECPLQIVRHVTDPNFTRQFGYSESVIQTRTNMALQRMFDVHKPKLWCFCHFHRRWEGDVLGTKFVYLDMIRDHSANVNKNAYMDLDERGNIV